MAEYTESIFFQEPKTTYQKPQYQTWDQNLFWFVGQSCVRDCQILHTITIDICNNIELAPQK